MVLSRDHANGALAWWGDAWLDLPTWINGVPDLAADALDPAWIALPELLPLSRIHLPAPTDHKHAAPSRMAWGDCVGAQDGHPPVRVCDHLHTLGRSWAKKVDRLDRIMASAGLSVMGGTPRFRLYDGRYSHRWLRVRLPRPPPGWARLKEAVA